MRLIVLGLLGLNLLFALWLLLVPAPQPNAPLPVASAPGVELLAVERALSGSAAQDPAAVPDLAADVEELSSRVAGPPVVEAEQAAARTDVVSPELCALIGPFRAEADVARVERGLAPHAGTELVHEEVPVVTMHRVYLHSANRDEALSFQARLQERFAELGEEVSSFVIGTGELSGHLSLGVFRQQSNAVQWQERLAGMGFPARVHEVVEQQSRAWLLVTIAPGSTQSVISASDLAAIDAALQYEENLCETIAPGGHLP